MILESLSETQNFHPSLMWYTEKPTVTIWGYFCNPFMIILGMIYGFMMFYGFGSHMSFGLR